MAVFSAFCLQFPALQLIDLLLPDASVSGLTHGHNIKK